MALHRSLPNSQCAATCPLRRVDMLRRFAQHGVLPRLLSSGRPSSRGLLQQVHSTANDSNGISSSASLNKVKETLQILERSLMYEANGQYGNSQGAQQTFASFAARALRTVEQTLSAAAAQDPQAAAGPVSSLAANLLHYAELLDQYEGFQHSQRQKLVESLQLQLLPQVNALAGLPIPSVLTHSRNTPQILVTQVRQQEPFKQQVAPPQQQQQQQQQVQQHQQQQDVTPRASVKQRGPQLGPVGAKRQRLKQQPLPQHEADLLVETSQPKAQQQQATQQQQPFQQQQEPQQQVQEQEQLAAHKRRPGPPGPRGRSPGPRLTGSAAIPPASLGGATSHTQPAQQQQQPPPPQKQQQRPEEDQRSSGVPRRPASPSGPPRGPPMRQHSAPAFVWRPPTSSTAAGATPASPPAAAAPPAASPKDGQQLQPTPQRPAAPGALLRTSSSTGPYPPRRPTPYPREPTGEELQLLHQMHQPQQVMPAWQLYFPLPEELGGPARHTVAAAAAAAAAATTPLLAPTPSEASAGAAITTLQHQLEQLQVMSVTEGVDAGGAASEDDAGAASDVEAGVADDGSSSSSSSTKWARNKALTEQKWQALLASAHEHQARVQQEQQRQQQEAAGELKQRTGPWLRLRESRLTGSALANMLSWFDGYNRADHVKLWREKLGLQHPPPPTEKMLYGTRNEHLALSSYQQLAPHEALQEMGFALWGSDCAHEWLAASPDGLITARGLDTLMQHGAAGSSSGGSSGLEVSGAAVSVSEEVAEWVKQQTGSSLDGVLEIKCPFKASPHADSPHLPKKMDAYYMPQVQVLCEVLEREWAVVYYWSEGKGSHMTLVHRDRHYFDLLWRAMADFWWRHLVPAKLLLDADPSDASAVSAVEQAYTPRLHPYRSEIIRRSRAMVEAAPQRSFTPEQTVAGLTAAAAAGPAAAEADSSNATIVEGPCAGSS